MKTSSEKKNYEVAAGYMILSAVSIAFVGLFGKLALAIDSIPVIIFLRFFLPFLFILPILAMAGTFRELSFFRQAPSQILRCLCVVISQYCFFYYLTKSSLLNASLLFNTGPIFIPLLGRIFYKHKIERLTITTIIISMIGVVCILKPTTGIIDIYGIFGLLSGLFMAGSQTIYGVNAKKEKSGVNLFYLFFLPSIFSIPALYLFESNIQLLLTEMLSNTSIYYVLGLAITSILNQTFRGFAYQRTSAASLAPFLYISTLISALCDWWLFDHTPTFLTLVGFLLIVFASISKLYLHRKLMKAKDPLV